MRLNKTISTMATLTLSLMFTACAGTGASASGPSKLSHLDAAAELPGPTTGRLVAKFDAAAGELPEGFILTADSAFVGFAPTSKVARVDLATGLATPFGSLPQPIVNMGFMTGMAQSASGEVYAGLASFVPEVQAGIYRIPKAGGAATLFAKDSALGFPNAITFDPEGLLWVTDSGSGSVFRIDADGQAVRWATGDALTGDKDACGAAGPGFAIGANGLVVEPDAVYVVNMDQATLVKIPRADTGEAGIPELLAGPDCDALGGADGLVRAPDGSFLIAVNRQSKIVQVTSGGGVETVVSGAPLDFPATLAYRGTTLYATNFALASASAGKSASPGVVQFSH
jgi:sugar lactone lactonase YvrE